MSLAPGKPIPATACPNCGGSNLGFDCWTAKQTQGQAVYQGCNDCSETTWAGSFDDFVAIIEIWHDIKIPLLD